MKWKIAPEHDDMLIKEFLQNQGFSRRILKAVKFEGGRISLNGKDVTVRQHLKTDDELEVIFPPEQRGDRMEAEELDLDIVYEDEDVLVLNKRAGIATIPSRNHPKGTIANGLLAHYERKDLDYTVHIVTRLDKDTSGLLLVAKHRFSHSALSFAQKQGKINRRYTAGIEGTLAMKCGTIDAPIGRKSDSLIEREVRADGQYAVTHYQVRKEFQDRTSVEVRLETGRTHQIRVHFAHLGHPLLGDTLYGGTTKYINRQALHCHSLEFNHPATKERMHFTAKAPEDFEGLL
nr:RluA family pseudouridine synthase [Sediminibacillus massiliensis]